MKANLRLLVMSKTLRIKVDMNMVRKFAYGIFYVALTVLHDRAVSF